MLGCEKKANLHKEFEDIEETEGKIIMNRGSSKFMPQFLAHVQLQ